MAVREESLERRNWKISFVVVCWMLVARSGDGKMKLPVRIFLTSIQMNDIDGSYSGRLFHVPKVNQ